MKQYSAITKQNTVVRFHTTNFDHAEAIAEFHGYTQVGLFVGEYAA